MLVFYYYFVGGWYGSAVMFVMLQLVPAYKEQLVDYYGISILQSLRNIAVWSVFYFLYGGVPLLKHYQKKSRMTTFCCKIVIISLHNHSSPFHGLKTTIEQTKGFTIRPFSSLAQNQGRTRKLVILTCFWKIIQYGPMKMKEACVPTSHTSFT